MSDIKIDYDVLIAGGGVVGLAIANNIASAGRSAVVLERHESFGRETSSRNSEVIHAGIYYPTGTLKARLCVAGNRSLYDWCDRHKVGSRRTGKFIVAVNAAEEAALEDILRQARTNGVDGIFPFPMAKFHKLEPGIKATAALWSPSTGIIDSHALMASLEGNARRNGCDFAYMHSVAAIEPAGGYYKVTATGPGGGTFTVNVKHFINSAGLDSDTVAGLAGIETGSAGLSLKYSRGHYFRIKSSKKGLVRHLIYPVPQRDINGLGIHITIDMNGELKLGPDVQYLPDRRQDYAVAPQLQEKFYLAASNYIEGLGYDDIYPDQAGIRPKLQAEGGAFRDFYIAEETQRGLPGFINLIGIESPGLTSCLEIARMVADMTG